MGAVAYKAASSAGLRVRPSAIGNPEIRLSHAGMPRTFQLYTPFWRRDLVSSLIVVAAITFVFCATVFVGSLRQVGLPDILGEDYNASFASAYAPPDKDSFLLRLNTAERRKVAAQVHYVSEIIRSSRSKTEDINKIAYSIVLESGKLDIDPFFTAAVIKSESNFNRKALSYAGALGLMQIMPATGKFVSDRIDLDWHGTAKLTDPYYNIKLGVAYLKHLEALFKGNRELMLIAYNWGPANLSDALKSRSHVPSSTKRYARTIISDHARWRSDFTDRLPEFQYLSLANVG